LVLVDARRGPLDGDFELLEFCSAIDLACLVCATKCDKLGASERGLLPRQFAQTLGIDPRDVLLTSASSGQGLTVGDREGGLGDILARLTREAELADADTQGESERTDAGTYGDAGPVEGVGS
jgi:GTP-binding protein